MLTREDVQRMARKEAAQLLADFACYLRAIVSAKPGKALDARDIDLALGQVVTPILKPAAPGADHA